MSDTDPPRGSESILLDAATRYLQAVRASGSRDVPLSLTVFQFSHTPLYAPVYMALETLRGCCHDAGGCWLELDYRSTFSDAATLDAVRAAATQPRAGRLELGVSEVSGDVAAGELVSKPFVKRLPLWGVALKNNRRINAVKATLSDRRRDFNQLFCGKLSVLQPAHFCAGPDGPGLRFSIYDTGSTAFRLFTAALPGLRTAEYVTVLHDDDFGPLLKGQVDVALTVQPWRGVRLAQASHTKLEIVYTLLSRPEPISSIFMLGHPGDDLGLTRHFVDVLGALVQFYVAQLYAGVGGPEAYASYRAARREQAAIESREDFTLAMELLSDSRVYFHELGDHESRRKVLAQRLRQSLACHFNTGDPIYVMSNHVVRLQECGLNWHRSARADKLSVLLERPDLSGIGKAFSDFSREFNVPIRDSDTPQARKEAWRLSDPRKLFRPCRFVLEGQHDIAFNPWRILLDRNGERLNPARRENVAVPGSVQVEFCPWVHPDLLEQAFMHLTAQFKGGRGNTRDNRLLKPRRMRADVQLLAAHVGDEPRTSNYEGLSWFWIEYDVQCPSPTPANKFMQCPTGRTLLNMWCVNPCDEPAVSHVFRRQEHGNFEVAPDGRVLLYTAHCPALIVERLEGHYGLLFTFRVRGQVC